MAAFNRPACPSALKTRLTMPDLNGPTEISRIFASSALVRMGLSKCIKLALSGVRFM